MALEGEDPWNDLPRASLPGFEGEQAPLRAQNGWFVMENDMGQ